MNPKVSIVIPVYNGSNYLKEAIDSALAQTYKNIEILVINDGSNDEGATEKIAKSYGNKIRYFHKANGGVATALNLGIKKMTGEYFSWLSHDDIYKPNKLEKQIGFLSKQKNKKIVLYSDYDLINESGRRIGRCMLDHQMLERAPIYSLLRGVVNGVTMLVPKIVFETHGNFDVSLWVTQDYDMWYRISSAYEFIHMPGIVSMTRIHTKQDTAINPRVVSEGNVLWKKMIRNLPEEAKVSAEGDIFKFYVEMTKFLGYTPYSGAQAYCGKVLEETAQRKEIAEKYSINTQEMREIYDDVVKIGQKKAAAYFLANVINQMIKNGEKESVATIIHDRLVGDEAGLSIKEIKDVYLSKIGIKSSKPRLMFCSGHWLTGGMERVLSIVFEQLKTSYDLFLITPNDDREGRIDLPEHVTHIKMSNKLFYESFDSIALSYALLFDVDVIVGFMNLWDGQLDLYKLCKGTGIRTIASSHEMYFYPYMNSHYYKLVDKRLNAFRVVDAVLWPTNFSAAAYGLSGDNSYLMPNPNAYEVHKPKIKPDPYAILCVGRFNDYVKRIDRILECFSSVNKVVPDARLILVGKCDRAAPFRPGDATTIDDLIKNYHITEDKITIVGEVNDVEKYYSKASVLLLASNNEGFGMVINEAACFGVPAVCNSIPGLEDLVSDGQNGFLVEQGDIRAMADAVIKIISDPKLRSRLGDNARRMVVKFDAKEVGARWRFLINTLLGNHATAEIHSILNEKLSYRITDYREFSRALFMEMNNVVAANLREIKDSTGEKRDFIDMLKHNANRLRQSIKAKGIKETLVVIVTKSYRRIKRS